MRSLLLFLVIANLLFAALQFDLFGPVLHPEGTRVEAIQPEKLRLVRGTARPPVATKRTTAVPPTPGTTPSTE